MFTAGQIASFILAAIGLVLTILNIIDKAATLKRNADAPIKEMQKEINDLKVKLEEHERSLQRGNDDFKEIRRALESLQGCMSIIVDFEVSFCDRMEYKEGSEEIIEARKRLRELSSR